MKRQILPSITTAGKARELWRGFLTELDALSVQECALFLTGLCREERDELYALLADISARTGLSIPFVHARSDMEASEYDFLISTFGTRRFNLHPVREKPLAERLPLRLRRMIYIENTVDALRPSDLRGFAGICADLSHLEDYRRQNRAATYDATVSLMQRAQIGVSHVSAIARKPYVFKDGSITYAPHRVESLADLSYLRGIPRHYFGEYVALELENSIQEQLIFKRHIERNIWRVAERQPSVLLPAWQSAVAA